MFAQGIGPDSARQNARSQRRNTPPGPDQKLPAGSHVAPSLPPTLVVMARLWPAASSKFARVHVKDYIFRKATPFSIRFANKDACERPTKPRPARLDLQAEAYEAQCAHGGTGGADPAHSPGRGPGSGH